MMIRNSILIGLLNVLTIILTWGQTSVDTAGAHTYTNYFISPVAHTIRLAGSFGEIRSNHFHAGIDIKSSRGTVGDTLVAAADGFISRIKVQAGSYGQVLYIDHPNGYTTVYAHMEKFADSIDEYIHNLQMESKSYEVDIYPDADKFVVKQGEYIGLMGNTGMSYGPHLHFEIRKTDTEIPQNPYLFNLGPKDSSNPLMYSVSVEGIDNRHTPISKEIKYINGKPSGVYGPEYTFDVPAWRAGIAVQTFDLMDGAPNKNGVYQIKMFVDDTLYFHHKIDAVGFDETKFINSHINFDEKTTNNRTLIKCYVSPGNPLGFYPTVINNGEVKLFKNKSRKIDLVVSDFYDNESTYTCYVRRREAKEGEIKEKVFQKYFPFGEDLKVKLGSCAFYFPKGSFDKDAYLTYEESKDENFQFTLNKDSEPLFMYPVVSIPVENYDTTLYSKLVLVHGNKTSFGGSVDNDSLRVRIGKLGSFEVKVDTIPPKIDVKSFLSNAVGKPFFRFEIYDEYETRGYARDIKYDVFIDGEWVVASLKALGNTLIVPLEDVEPGDHTLKIRVEDHSGNINEWERTFKN